MNPERTFAPQHMSTSKPYCIVGAGSLTSNVWKRICTGRQAVYRLNLFRTKRNGRVTQLLRPEDVLPLAKCVRVISQVLADDGCTSTDQRRLLHLLADALDEVLECDEIKHFDSETSHFRHGST